MSRQQSELPTAIPSGRNLHPSEVTAGRTYAVGFTTACAPGEKIVWRLMKCTEPGHLQFLEPGQDSGLGFLSYLYLLPSEVDA